MSEPFVLEKEQTLTVPQWKRLMPDFVVGFTTKNGGVSEGPFRSLNTGLHVFDSQEHVGKNKEIIADITDIPTKYWVGCEQTHENNIEKIDHTHRGKGVYQYTNALKSTDGIYTNSKEILLTLCFADCVPLYFFSPGNEYIGLAHAGWKGTVKNIAGEMIGRWKAEGINVDDILVAIGPSISKNEYIVDGFLVDQVKKALPSTSYHHVFSEVSPGQFQLDLQAVNVELLKIAGVKEENILCSSYCTSKDKNLFFSHRRDEGKTGRMMSFIGMKGANQFE